jgi:hypothetical protein
MRIYLSFPPSLATLVATADVSPSIVVQIDTIGRHEGRLSPLRQEQAAY